MKKLMLTIASLLFVSVLAVNAQVQDTTSASQPSTGIQQQQDLNYDEMEAIQSSDVPASLRSSLQGSEYSGWEAGKVYRHKANNEYVVVIGDEDAKVYRFDSNGTRVQDGSTQPSDKAVPESGTPPTGATPETTTPAPAPSPAPAPAK
jgi:hypothetical protein